MLLGGFEDAEGFEEGEGFEVGGVVGNDEGRNSNDERNLKFEIRMTKRGAHESS